MYVHNQIDHNHVTCNVDNSAFNVDVVNYSTAL